MHEKNETSTFTFTVEIVRTVRVSVEVNAETPEAAIQAVDLRSFELPPADAWSVDKDSYEYAVDGEDNDTDG